MIIFYLFFLQYTYSVNTTKIKIYKCTYLKKRVKRFAMCLFSGIEISMIEIFFSNDEEFFFLDYRGDVLFLGMAKLMSSN